MYKDVLKMWRLVPSIYSYSINHIKEKIDESAEGYYIVAEIIDIAADEKYLCSDGNPDVEKMQLITYNPIQHTYIALAKTVGNAFSDGKKLK